MKCRKFTFSKFPSYFGPLFNENYDCTLTESPSQTLNIFMYGVFTHINPLKQPKCRQIDQSHGVDLGLWFEIRYENSCSDEKTLKFCHDVRCRDQWGFEVSGGFPRETIPGVNSLSVARWKSYSQLIAFAEQEK